MIAQKDFKSSTFLYDSLIDQINTVSKDTAAMKKLVRVIQFITDKNTDVLNTNIVGYSLLINETDQKNILDCLNLTKKELIDLCKKSPRLNGVGKVVDQFAFALPLLILAGCLANNKQEKLSQGVFLFTYYRAYASKVTTFFRLGTVDEKAMEYTVNIALTDKSYIHKFGSVYAVLVESAKSAYSAFISSLQGKPSYPTDDMLFNNIFYSAIFSKTGSWIKSLYSTYIGVKRSGKALDYEMSYYSTYDDDSGDDNYEENNINSVSSGKRAVVAKAVTKFNISPIDNKLVTLAATYGNGSPSKAYEDFLKQIIAQISETRTDIIPKYFDAIVGAFLDSSDNAGEPNTTKDISTIKFLAYSKRIFKTSHTLNSNIREEQNTTEEILISCSPKYVTSEIKTKRKMKLALYMYFILFIQRA